MSITTETPLVTLRDLVAGDHARVLGIADHLEPAACRRLADLGFSTDTPVQCLRKAPWGSPVVYCIGETELCLRGDLASCVLVERAR